MPAPNVDPVYYTAVHGTPPHHLKRGDWQFAPAARGQSVVTVLSVPYHVAIKQLAEQHPQGGQFYLLPVIK